MKNTNKRILKAAALSTVAATMAVAAMPVRAEDANDGITKNEDVFVVLNSDGTVSKTTVSDTLHSDSGFSNYDDKSSLTDAQNLKSTDALTKSSDGYVWNTTDKDIYYQGTYSGDLPLSVSISYTLDGKSISEEDLLGQSGHVVITMDLSNNKYKYYKVNGKTCKVAMPIAAVTGAVMDKDVFSNVTVNEGKVTSDSSHDIVATVCLPGMRDSLESLVTTNSLESIDEYLTDQIVIDADVTDYEAPEMMLAASTNTDELKTELGGTDLSSVWGDMDKLQAATQQLIDGTKSIYDGANQLSTGASQLDTGAQQLVDGAASLEDGADQVSEGAASLESGLGQLSSKSAELNAGAKQIEEGVFNSASTQINNEDAVKASGKTYTLTESNYADVLAELLEINDAERTQAKAEIAAKLNAASGKNLDENTVNAIIYMASIHNTNNDFEAACKTQGSRLIAAQKVQTYAGTFTTKDAVMSNTTSTGTTVNAILAGIVSYKTSSSYELSAAEYNATKAQIIAGIRAKGSYASYTDDQVWAGFIGQTFKAATDDQNVKAYVASQFKANLTADKVYDAVSAQLKAADSTLTDANVAMMIAYTADTYHALDSASFAESKADIQDAVSAEQEMTTALTSGQEKIKSTLTTLVANSTAYQASNEKLKSLQNSLDGMINFVEGLRTYTNGVDSAYAGSQTLAAGASQVADGAASLKEGASQLKTGIDTLSTGINTLRDGAKTLMDGMEQYNSDGISKITDSTEVSDIKNATQLLQEIKQESDDYNNYSGISDGTTGSVKFVYKVQTVKAEKDTSTASTNSDVTHVNDGSTFWSRLADLFVFWK